MNTSLCTRGTPGSTLPSSAISDMPPTAAVPVCAATIEGRCMRRPRSEEHTSELQSPCNLVCRLLLEKKKRCVTVATQRGRLQAVVSDGCRGLSLQRATPWARLTTHLSLETRLRPIGTAAVPTTVKT